MNCIAGYTRSTLYTIRMKWEKHTSMKYFWTLKLKSSALQITERYIALMTRRGLGGLSFVFIYLIINVRYPVVRRH